MCIEISRQQNSKYIIPERFRDDYATALEKIDDLASIYESNEDNEQFKKILKATHLVISGNIEDAENVLDE